MKNKSLILVPKTGLGWWSVGLIVAMPILFFVGTSFTNSLYASVPSGNSILEDITVRPALALTMLAGMAAGVSALITGFLAILWKKERALLVIFSTAFGALFTVFLIAELI